MLHEFKKMNILITGCDGFLGRNLVHFLESKYNIFAASKKELDLLDRKKIDKFFSDNRIDTVLHTAIVGRGIPSDNTFNSFLSNLIMFNNLYENRNKFGRMINFGSGAEFDREQKISLVEEKQLFNRLPTDFYGLAKNLMTRRIININANIYNLRIFGCFGHDEPQHRLIKSAIKCVLENKPITINDDIYMDFFYVNDVCRVVEHYLTNCDLHKDMNLVYMKKTKLSDVVNMIFEESNRKVNLDIKQKSSRCYNGSGALLDQLNLNLVGLRQGIKEVYGQEAREYTRVS